jgi:hypothetical protein
MEKRKSMISFYLYKSTPLATRILPVLLAAACVATPALRAQQQASKETPSQGERQTVFSAPEEAMQALLDATKAKDRAALNKIFGPGSDALLSGDAVEDKKDLEDFAAAVQESTQLQKDDDVKYTLVVGKNHWPFPIPIVKPANQWAFDTKQGIDEILNRRIGENELSAIATCRAYTVAQWEYFTEGDQDRDGVAEYARKFVSSPGQHDGLYWDTSEDEKPSPLGELVAAARAEGYGPQEGANKDGTKKGRRPYHGYFFKILTRQGPHAPGGKYSYIINGNMIAGNALLAYPDKWKNSGVMTFIVNQQGRVYEKNLGPNTAKIAGSITEYDPDLSWKLVEP